MPVFTDQLDREVSIGKSPKRIISLVPSQTELLYDLGLDEEVIGITAYCIHPKNWLNQKQVIGGTKNINITLIKKLEPDLIICNKEENPKEQIEELAKEFPVWVSDVVSLESAKQMIIAVGEICDRKSKADDIILQIKMARSKIEKLPPLKFLYFIWKDPFMVAGHESFISKMLEEAGLVNAAPKSGDRYPKIEMEDISKTGVQILILSSEPYKFTSLNARNMTSLRPQPLIKIMDGELTSWYGSRISLYFKYLPLFISEIQLKFRLK